MAHVWVSLEYENEHREGDEWGRSEIRRLQGATTLGNGKWGSILQHVPYVNIQYDPFQALELHCQASLADGIICW